MYSMRNNGQIHQISNVPEISPVHCRWLLAKGIARCRRRRATLCTHLKTNWSEALATWRRGKETSHIDYRDQGDRGKAANSSAVVLACDAKLYDVVELAQQTPYMHTKIVAFHKSLWILAKTAQGSESGDNSLSMNPLQIVVKPLS